MQENTNNERRKILKDRLAEIKEKHNPEHKTIATNHDYVSTKEPIEIITDNKSKSGSSVKYIIIIILLVLAGLYLSQSLDKPSKPSTKTKVPVKEFVLEYKLNLEGHSIAIISSSKEEEKAIEIKNLMKAKGFACDYFFLPKHSNSKEEVFQVFIGPYENMKETKQWTENIEQEFEIIVI